MAARRPFWKWQRWKSIGFCLWPPSTCIWNLKLKFQTKLDLCSGNHVVYRQTDGRTDGQTDRRTDGRTDGQGESSIPPLQLRWAGGITRTTRMPAFWVYPPPPHDYPYYWVILDPESNEDKVIITNLKNLPKFQLFELSNKLYMQHTSWSCLIRCANTKWTQQVLLKLQSGHDSVHRRTDRRTTWNQYTPFSTSLKRWVWWWHFCFSELSRHFAC